MRLVSLAAPRFGALAAAPLLSALGVLACPACFREDRVVGSLRAEPHTDSGASDTDDTDCDLADCPGKRCESGSCSHYSSCKTLFEARPSLPSGEYEVDFEGEPTQVFCDASDGGGWTLLLKADGTEQTFTYDSPLWTNTELLNPGSTNLNPEEAKLPGYASLGFTELRLGFRTGEWRWITAEAESTSLLAAVTRQVPISAGRSSWLSLVESAALQPFCGRERFSNFGDDCETCSQVRIGILGNNEDECVNPDSFIGFGGKNNLTGVDCDLTLTVSVGHGRSCGEVKNLPVFGYVMVR